MRSDRVEHNAKVDPNPQPIGTSRFIYGRLCLLCLLAGICRWSACPEFGKSSIEFCPDSGGYHILAVNLVQGKGYVQGPVGSLDDYDERTRQLLDGEAVVPVGRSVFGRTPGYPLCVAAIYLVHGVDPNWVLTYQKCLAILAASMLPIVGWLVLRRIGDLLGVLVAIWLAQTPSAGYPISQLLTECLAQFLLVLAAVLAALGSFSSTVRAVRCRIGAGCGHSHASRSNMCRCTTRFPSTVGKCFTQASVGVHILLCSISGELGRVDRVCHFDPWQLRGPVAKLNARDGGWH